MSRKAARRLDPRSPVSEAQIVVRLPDDLLDLVDAEVVRMRKAHPAMRVTRSDAVRALLFAGLQRGERR
jgi:hypothetical protein